MPTVQTNTYKVRFAQQLIEIGQTLTSYSIHLFILQPFKMHLVPIIVNSACLVRTKSGYQIGDTKILHTTYHFHCHNIRRLLKIMTGYHTSTDFLFVVGLLPVHVLLYGRAYIGHLFCLHIYTRIAMHCNAGTQR